MIPDEKLMGTPIYRQDATDGNGKPIYTPGKIVRVHHSPVTISVEFQGFGHTFVTQFSYEKLRQQIEAYHGVK